MKLHTWLNHIEETCSEQWRELWLLWVWYYAENSCPKPYRLIKRNRRFRQECWTLGLVVTRHHWTSVMDSLPLPSRSLICCSHYLSGPPPIIQASYDIWHQAGASMSHGHFSNPQYFQYISTFITICKKWLFDILFSSLMQLWYVEVRISRSISVPWTSR